MDFNLLTILFYLIILLVVVFIVLCVIMYITSESTPTIVEYDSEHTFVDPRSPDIRHLFPRLTDGATVDLSVIIPSYNEEERLPIMLEECLQFLEGRQKTEAAFKYEVIIVDDGSSDRTSGVGLEYSRKYGTEKVRVLTLQRNRGKGGAVRLGVLRSRGKLILFADADGATKFSDYQKLEDSIKCVAADLETDRAVVVGSRAHLEKESISERSFFRTILMLGFHFLVYLFCVRGVRDTQCGFKLFTRRSARILFTSLHIEKWAFDVELLFIAQKLNIPICEVAVNWTEIPGSKITPLLAAVQMGRDLVLVWFRYAIGAWKIARKD